MKNKTTLLLPPDEDSFEQHLLRTNYQAQIWYIFANPDAPSISLDHGYRQECLLVLPTPHTKEACPNSLRRLVNDETFESDDDKSNDDGDSLFYRSSSDGDSAVFFLFFEMFEIYDLHTMFLSLFFHSDHPCMESIANLNIDFKRKNVIICFVKYVIFQTYRFVEERD